MNRTTYINPEIREIIASYNILLEYFEQIKAYNEIGYQSIQRELFAELQKLEQKDHEENSAIENINKALEKSKTASGRIEQLSSSGTKMLRRLKENKLNL